MTEIRDAIIIGAGAAGAAAAWRLATSGIDVLCLEQGGWVDPASSPSSADDWEIRRQQDWHPNPNIRQAASDYPIDDSTSPIRPLMYNGVGGSTVMWSCHIPRFHPSDFRTFSLDGVGDDWPVSYEDLAPYYDLNEAMMGVAGQAGHGAYPEMGEGRLPAAPLGKPGRRMADCFDDLGWSWWPADLAVNTASHMGRDACNNCGPCELYCPTGSKGSVDQTYWPAALEAGAELRTGARVLRIETDADGHASAVIWRDGNGIVQETRARTILLAANGIGSARILLMSESGRHPQGLSNRSGLVGRRLMLHPLARVSACFDEPMDGHLGITAGGFVSHHFYETDTARGFPRGVKLQMLGTHGPALTALGSLGKRMGWGADHHREFAKYFGRSFSLSVCADDMPDTENRIVLNSERTDSDGLPSAQMIYRVSEDARAALDFGMDRAREALAHAGGSGFVEMDLVADAGFHLMGTARMGDDRETSVLDSWCEAHDTPGLFVIDGSSFVTGAAVNPTNTLQALALRAADRIRETRRERGSH